MGCWTDAFEQEISRTAPKSRIHFSRPSPTAAIILATFGSVQAQKLPASTTIGTNPAGTAFYAVSAGLAKVISGAGPMQSMVQPYTGSSTFLPLLDSGEIDFGIVNAVEMNLGYQGPAKLKISGKNPLPHVPNTRLIMRGSPLSVSLVVRKDSPIKTVHDIKGKRVTGEYPANIAIWFHVYTELANAGLDLGRCQDRAGSRRQRRRRRAGAGTRRRQPITPSASPK